MRSSAATCALVLFLVPTGDPPAAVGDDRFPADTQSAVLTLSKGDSLFVLDSLRRYGDKLEVRTNSVGRARFVIRATVTPNDAISEARVRVWPEGRERPQVDATITLEEDTLRWGTTGSEEREERSVPPNTLVYVPPSVAFLEQTARRARTLRSGPAEVSFTLWSPYQGGRTLPITARFPHRDTVTLSFGDATYRLAVDSGGNLLGGRLEPYGQTIVRR